MRALGEILQESLRTYPPIEAVYGTYSQPDARCIKRAYAPSRSCTGGITLPVKSTDCTGLPE